MRPSRSSNASSPGLMVLTCAWRGSRNSFIASVVDPCDDTRRARAPPRHERAQRTGIPAQHPAAPHRSPRTNPKPDNSPSGALDRIPIPRPGEGDVVGDSGATEGLGVPADATITDRSNRASDGRRSDAEAWEPAARGVSIRHLLRWRRSSPGRDARRSRLSAPARVPAAAAAVSRRPPRAVRRVGPGWRWPPTAASCRLRRRAGRPLVQLGPRRVRSGLAWPRSARPAARWRELSGRA